MCWPSRQHLFFWLLIVHPAYEFAHDEAVVTTPALEISNAFRAAALPVGSALMLLIALMRLLEVGSWRLVGGAVGIIAVGIAIVFGLKPLLFELDNINLLIFFVGIVALLCLCRCAHRLLFWAGHVRLSRRHHYHSTAGLGWSHG